MNAMLTVIYCRSLVRRGRSFSVNYAVRELCWKLLTANQLPAFGENAVQNSLLKKS